MIYRTRRLTCGNCGTLTRARVDPDDGTVLSPTRCRECASDTWLALPELPDVSRDWLRHPDWLRLESGLIRPAVDQPDVDPCGCPFCDGCDE